MERSVYQKSGKRWSLQSSLAFVTTNRFYWIFRNQYKVHTTLTLPSERSSKSTAIKNAILIHGFGCSTTYWNSGDGTTMRSSNSDCAAIVEVCLYCCCFSFVSMDAYLFHYMLRVCVFLITPNRNLIIREYKAQYIFLLCLLPLCCFL